MNSIKHTINDSNNINPLKRKRVMKTVQFSSKVTVLETYSSDEYDRSDIFSTPILYKINPNAVRSSAPQLSLNIECSLPPNLIKDEEGEEGSSSSAEVSPNTPPPCNSNNNEYFNTLKNKKMKRQRPILSVNTTICADPLFFTNLSTNYNKNNTHNETSDTGNDFLVPISSML